MAGMVSNGLRRDSFPMGNLYIQEFGVLEGGGGEGPMMKSPKYCCERTVNITLQS